MAAIVRASDAVRDGSCGACLHGPRGRLSAGVADSNDDRCAGDHGDRFECLCGRHSRGASGMLVGMRSPVFNKLGLFSELFKWRTRGSLPQPGSIAL